MEINVGFLELVRLGPRFIAHRRLQRQLATKETRVVTTAYGPVKGCKRKTLYDDDLYYAFEGVPYAKPPVGALRFLAPQPPDPWEEIKDCTECRSKPMQKHFILKFIEGSEDCLYLNIYAKKLESNKPLPVMVWIYGGGFQIGEASRDIYAPDYFMKQDIVLVEISYRLGALGFLSLEDPDIGVPGNAGLKDQLLALKWIKDNISHFNGDANNITLFGESAGAGSVHIHMLSERARGLFHKAILMSGAALCPWAQSDNRDWAYRLARSIGYKGINNDKEVFRFLSKVDARKISAHDNSLLTHEEKRDQLFISFGPVVEPYETEDCILSRPCVELLKTAWSNEIPIIIGGTSFEGLFSFNSLKQDPDMLNEIGNCESLLPPEIKKDGSPQELHEKGRILKKLYFDDTEPRMPDSMWQFLDLMSYYNFWHGLHRTVKARTTYTPPNVPTYLYRFDFDSPDFNHYRILKCGRGVRGISHADDVSYLFYTMGSWKLSKSSPEYRTIERMIGMWTSFARSSNPNCKEMELVTWEALEREDESPPRCLNIGVDLAFVDLPEDEKLKVWDSLLPPEKLY